MLDDDFSVDFNGASSIGNEHLYTGRRTDPETGLQLNRYRFYHQQLGRWVSRDPIGYDGGGFNLYEYVGGMPADSVDALGLHGNPFQNHGPQSSLPRPKPKPIPTPRRCPEGWTQVDGFINRSDYGKPDVAGSFRIHYTLCYKTGCDGLEPTIEGPNLVYSNVPGRPDNLSLFSIVGNTLRVTMETKDTSSVVECDCGAASSRITKTVKLNFVSTTGWSLPTRLSAQITGSDTVLNSKTETITSGPCCAAGGGGE